MPSGTREVTRERPPLKTEKTDRLLASGKDTKTTILGMIQRYTLRPDTDLLIAASPGSAGKSRSSGDSPARESQVKRGPLRRYGGLGSFPKPTIALEHLWL